MNRVKTYAFVAVLTSAVGAVAIATTQAYSVSAYKWASMPVAFYVNPNNADVSTNAATTALQAAMDAWNTQAGTPFRFSYAGQVSDTATANDRRNVIIFRPQDNGGTIATTYSWWSNGVRVDSDVVFWDGGWKFFTGSSGCVDGAYIEDIATHELGHSMGLSHSSVSGATMYPSYSRCSTSFRSLSSDDIAGAQALYGSGASSAPSNTAPTVSIAAPASGTSVTAGAATTFSGSASDGEDGNLTSTLAWTSNLDGALGTGSGFSRTLSAGSHTITARATDSGGLTTSRQVSVSVAASATQPTSTASLSVRPWKDKGGQKADLNWSGLTSTTVDVYRNSVRVASVSNSGAMTDTINKKGGGSYTYKVCAAGTSATCSNQAVASF